MNPITFIVKPVSATCNLRCHYCYHRIQRNENNMTRMNDFTLKAMIDRMTSLPQPKVRIIWHGGEPLLAGKEFYRKAIEWQTHGKFINLIQTNGVLIDENWTNILKSFHVGISIDGPKSLHNVHRVTCSDEGTFNDVMSGIALLKNAGIQVGGVTVITRETVDQPKEIFDFLYSNGIKQMNFSPCVDIGESYAITGEEFGKFLSEIFSLWMELDDPEVKIVPLDSLIRGLLGGSPSVCYYKHDCSNFLSIDADGSVYICGRSIGNIDRQIGNIVTDEIAEMMASEQFYKIRAQIINPSPDCQKCTWFSICQNGCPLERKDNKFLACETIKLLMPKLQQVVAQQELL